MNDGKLIFQLVRGEIVGVSVNAGLDLAYERLFRAAQGESQEDGSVDAGIKLIVFGCFWLEAVCNEVLRNVLYATVSPRERAKAVFDISQRTPFSKKLSLLATFLKCHEPATDALHRQLGQLFQSRNRLAHFKDEDTPFAGQITSGDFDPSQFDDPDLIAKLKPPLVLDDTQAVIEGIAWLQEVEGEVFNRTTNGPRLG